LAAPRSVCVFCGARPGADPRFLELARRTGTALARSGVTLVYGGGSIGMMGVLADAALQAGGEVIGVIPQSLMAREVGHAALSRNEVVPDMHLRKQRMVELSDAFLTLPGGFGTLDELFEVLTLRQLREHDKPIVLLNDQGYYDALMVTLRGIVAHELALARDLDLLHSVPSLQAALQALGCAAPDSFD
jgi:hypothetical protein